MKKSRMRVIYKLPCKLPTFLKYLGARRGGNAENNKTKPLTVVDYRSGAIRTMVKPRRKAVNSRRISDCLRFYCDYLEICGQSRGNHAHFRSIHPPRRNHHVDSGARPAAQPRAQTRNRASSATSATSKISSRSRGDRWTLASWWTANCIRFDMIVFTTYRPDQAAGAQQSPC